MSFDAVLQHNLGKLCWCRTPHELLVLTLQMTSICPNEHGPLSVHYLRQRDVLRGAQVQRVVVLPGQHQQLHSFGQLPMLQEEFGCMGSMLTVRLGTRWGSCYVRSKSHGNT